MNERQRIVVRDLIAACRRAEEMLRLSMFEGAKVKSSDWIDLIMQLGEAARRAEVEGQDD